MARRKTSSSIEKISSQPTQTLVLSIDELIHLRDMLGVILPGQGTLSISLAHLLNKTDVETKLWEKVETACIKADIATGDYAPDYVVSVSAPPPLGVYLMGAPPTEGEGESDDE
jgi:hypothetical protein